MFSPHISQQLIKWYCSHTTVALLYTVVCQCYSKWTVRCNHNNNNLHISKQGVIQLLSTILHLVTVLIEEHIHSYCCNQQSYQIMSEASIMIITDLSNFVNMNDNINNVSFNVLLKYHFKVHTMFLMYLCTLLPVSVK